ncbi:protein arginine N-methyltransferase 2-like [Saccoglossus kowalevskii]|uniref:Protein arginine N-methyltransferase 2-like n=1 Tax=Saccoglossus kowalevskii TaxID=10224 RepID=A0ABM0MRN2_SACKO|nr:PREDICTED: protein arginine N-methyltransferase 2-like [Saccoglossus kowalevskii]
MSEFIDQNNHCLVEYPLNDNTAQSKAAEFLPCRCKEPASTSLVQEKHGLKALPSQDEMNEAKTNYDTGILNNKLQVVVAFSDFKAVDDNQLSFCRGDEMQILYKPNSDWWWAEIHGNEGYIPTNHITEKTREEWEADRWQDVEYFDSYADLKLHLEMLSDNARTNAYKDAIIQNAESLSNKVVVDVGCGTGILSLLCAKHANVKQVYGVEASDIVHHTQHLIDQNGLTNKITIFKDKVENITLPDKVDIIISEWMGTLLLFELMIESVLLARNLWLKDTGVMWPSDASLYLVPCSATDEYNKKIAFWDCVYGFDFSYLKSFAMQEYFGKPVFNHELKSTDCLDSPLCVLKMKMKTFQIDELEEIVKEFSFKVTKKSTFHGFASWFSVDFGGFNNQNTVTLDTGPTSRLTHWKQDLFMMNDAVQVTVGDKIEGSIVIKRNAEWRRHLVVTFKYQMIFHCDQNIKNFEKTFPLWK